MARPKSTANASIHVPDLDQQIQVIARTIEVRYSGLKGELDGLSETYLRITGKPLSKARLNGAAARRATATAATARATTRTKAGKKRQRKPGVDLAWLQQSLGERPMTLKELQGVAEQQGRSGLSVMTVLRANKGKFKTSPGTKQQGVKGVPAQVYGMK